MRKTIGFTRRTLDFTRKTFDITRKTLDFTRKTVIYDTNGLPYNPVRLGRLVPNREMWKHSSLFRIIVAEDLFSLVLEAMRENMTSKHFRK